MLSDQKTNKQTKETLTNPTRMIKNQGLGWGGGKTANGFQT
jgi:hypothetical protein